MTTTPSNRLYVNFSGLSSYSERELFDLFAKYGKILNHAWKGTYGFIEFSSVQQATDAKTSVHGTFIHGKRANIDYSSGRGIRHPGERSNGSSHHHSNNNNNNNNNGGDNRMSHGSSGNGSSIPKTPRIYVRGYDHETTSSYDLKLLFGEVGEITASHFVDKRGYGFIEFKGVEEAERAINKYHNFDIHGRRITVNFATLPGPKDNNNGGPRYRSRSRSPNSRIKRSRYSSPNNRGSRSRSRSRSHSPVNNMNNMNMNQNQNNNYINNNNNNNMTGNQNINNNYNNNNNQNQNGYNNNNSHKRYRSKSRERESRGRSRERDRDDSNNNTNNNNNNNNNNYNNNYNNNNMNNGSYNNNNNNYNNNMNNGMNMSMNMNQSNNYNSNNNMMNSYNQGYNNNSNNYSSPIQQPIQYQAMQYQPIMTSANDQIDMQGLEVVKSIDTNISIDRRDDILALPSNNNNNNNNISSGMNEHLNQQQLNDLNSVVVISDGLQPTNNIQPIIHQIPIQTMPTMQETIIETNSDTTLDENINYREDSNQSDIYQLSQPPTQQSNNGGGGGHMIQNQSTGLLSMSGLENSGSQQQMLMDDIRADDDKKESEVPNSGNLNSFNNNINNNNNKNAMNDNGRIMLNSNMNTPIITPIITPIMPPVSLSSPLNIGVNGNHLNNNYNGSLSSTSSSSSSPPNAMSPHQISRPSSSYLIPNQNSSSSSSSTRPQMNTSSQSVPVQKQSSSSSSSSSTTSSLNSLSYDLPIELKMLKEQIMREVNFAIDDACKRIHSKEIVEFESVKNDLFNSKRDLATKSDHVSRILDDTTRRIINTTESSSGYIKTIHQNSLKTTDEMSTLKSEVGLLRLELKDSNHHIDQILQEVKSIGKWITTNGNKSMETQPTMEQYNKMLTEMKKISDTTASVAANQQSASDGAVAFASVMKKLYPFETITNKLFNFENKLEALEESLTSKIHEIKQDIQTISVDLAASNDESHNSTPTSTTTTTTTSNATTTNNSKKQKQQEEKETPIKQEHITPPSKKSNPTRKKSK